ncbi:Acetyl-CoA synthetase [Mycena indigotica]|uniref:Acetyl-CoA synthetase n=1 Tax=Mycena indigotica TaxID=2126181 RepID=A0A8H6S937_9AGAR|nr:Acetyl-CoA synthetase [Mycena indigotica]KAF7295099.1 Acetyl-CoA synthetase [Mycena indigotica]
MPLPAALTTTDETTILLGLIAATIFLLNNLYKPQPLVHPILLGRQSDVARVRNPGESAIYRNYGTGLMGRFPLRPAKDVHILADMLKPDSDAPRMLWSTRISNPQLQDRIAAFGTGLLRLAGLEVGESNVLLLLNDSIEFIIADLALASHSIPSFTLSASNLLSPVLESHPPSAIITHSFMLSQVLELIYDAGETNRNHTIIVVGEPSAQAMATVASRVKVLKWADVEREGVRVEKIISPLPKPSDVFTLSFFSTESGQIQSAQLTHENFTAGVAAVRALLPLSHAFSQLDTVVSAHSLGSAYGRAIAYTALFEGTSFATLDGSKLFHDGEHTSRIDLTDALSANAYPIPPTTLAFVKPGHLQTLGDAILKQARKSFFLFPLAWRHKLAGIADGYVTKESLWDRLVLDAARAHVAGDGSAALRAVIVSEGSIPGEILTPSRAALSVPVINCFSHPLVAGPVLASHALDLQDLGTKTAHSGPPSINIEAKLVGVEDDVVEQGGDPTGVLMVRGPPVGKLASMEASYVSIPGSSDEEEWIGTGVRATVLPNGAFVVN